jgi:hypothetical protein
VAHMIERNKPKQTETSAKLFRHLAGIRPERNSETCPYRGGEKCFAPLAPSRAAHGTAVPPLTPGFATLGLRYAGDRSTNAAGQAA